MITLRPDQKNLGDEKIVWFYNFLSVIADILMSDSHVTPLWSPCLIIVTVFWRLSRSRATVKASGLWQHCFSVLKLTTASLKLQMSSLAEQSPPRALCWVSFFCSKWPRLRPWVLDGFPVFLAQAAVLHLFYRHCPGQPNLYSMVVLYKHRAGT